MVGSSRSNSALLITNAFERARYWKGSLSDVNMYLAILAESTIHDGIFGV